MKLYISANTDQPQDRLNGFVLKAIAEIEHMGHVAISPLSHDGILLPWSLRLEVLTKECHGIYLLEGWQDSLEASTERLLCLTSDKKVIFQSSNQRKVAFDQEKVASALRVQMAIHEVTGYTIEEYRIHSRKEDLVFCRMIFSYQGKRMDLSPDEISRNLNISRSMVYHYLKVYPGEIRFNPKFRGLAERVEKLIQ